MIPLLARIVERGPWISLAILFLTFCRPGLAQVFDLDKDREPIVVLDGLWRFHPGDDPHWADPGFEDSTWALISSEKSWSDQGYKGMSGVAWYRVKVFVPQNEEPLSLFIPSISIRTSYQVFADGKLVGGLGGMPPYQHADAVPTGIYSLPQPFHTSARMLSIAIRVWHWPGWARYIGGGLRGGIELGNTKLIQDRGALRDLGEHWNTVSTIFLAIFEALAGLAGGAFFLLRPREKEYLWFCTMMVLSVALEWFQVYVAFHLFGVLSRDLIEGLIGVGWEAAQIGFYFHLLRGKRDWFFWLAGGSVAFYLLVVTAGELGLIRVTLWNGLEAAAAVPLALWILVLLFRTARQRVPDARLLLAPVLVQQLTSITVLAIWMTWQAGWYRGSVDWLVNVSRFPFPYSLNDLSDALFLIGMLAILVRRFTRTLRQEESFANELESARIVQQVLIPQEIPTITGFFIDSAYRPAGQVGGDFFQIIPASDGGAVIVIGDVSGKGMPAAMTVSLLVGTVRTLAHYTYSPAEILAAMNLRMLARSKGGFTTCLILRADLDGTITIANAGHLSPYRNGVEIPCENGLPLGLAADSVYQESMFQLAENERITLLTDGVVEARNKSGELLGFERTAAIAANPAEWIAQYAHAFGQEDDITVLTLIRRLAELPSDASLTEPVLSPSAV